jgi:hypothetical protein
MVLPAGEMDFTAAGTHHHPHGAINSVLRSLNPSAGGQLQRLD